MASPMQRMVINMLARYAHALRCVDKHEKGPAVPALLQLDAEVQPRSAVSTSSSIFFASPNNMRLLSL
jgi:hypothetical protein